MPRKRSSKRRRSPVAALVAIVILGGTALALDSRNPASRESQTAAVIAQTQTQTGQSQGATSQKICINDTHIRVTIGSVADSKPQVETKCWTAAPADRDRICPNPGNPPQAQPKDGCSVQFCAPRKPTNDDASTGHCTDEVYYENENAMQRAMPSTNAAAANVFVASILSTDKQADPGSVTSGMELGTSKMITGAFEQQQKQMDVVGNAYSQLSATNQMLLDCLASQDSSECNGQLKAHEEATARVAQEEAKLRALQSAQSLSGQQGNLSNVPRIAVDNNQTTQSPADQSNAGVKTGNQSTFGNSVGNNAGGQARQPSGCSGLSCFFTTGGQTQQQCGYVNGQYLCVQSQRCNAIQQFISGCPNPLMPGQQQCGGLMAMLDKCPAGSYNPNNPSNPYNYPAPTCSIQATPSSAAAGQAVTLRWQSQYAQYANLSSLGQVGPSGSTTVYPQGPTTYVMNVVGYGNQQGQCQAQFGGAGTGTGTGTGGTPTAQVSCQPLLADMGTQVAISYACQNSATSVGSGFTTGGSLSGSTVVTVGAPALGQHTINYGLTCSNQGQTHSAQCTVNVNKAAIVLVANPKTVESGEEATIGWVTSGMDSCVISSSNAAFTEANAGSTNVSGAAKTPALTQDASFALTCTTKAGGTKIASTTVQVTD